MFCIQVVSKTVQSQVWGILLSLTLKYKWNWKFTESLMWRITCIVIERALNINPFTFECCKFCCKVQIVVYKWFRNKASDWPLNKKKPIKCIGNQFVNMTMNVWAWPQSLEWSLQCSGKIHVKSTVSGNVARCTILYYFTLSNKKILLLLD